MRKLFATIAIVAGALFTFTFQGWGMIVMRFIGFERALGESSVRRLDDGTVLLTNPQGMLFWSSPFLVLGVVLFCVGVRTWGRRSE